ncbi:MAG TPA: flagellar M-ring protein FliF, partial [Alphaproteobacteria bacterium]|nr:flagellar M-ring protein FliF [Alphaproteobacteria bacterium]
VAKDEAVAVRHLVTSSVPGLKSSKVTIIDNNGKVLSKAKGDDDSEYGGTADSAEFKLQMEDRLRRTINDLLTQAVGEGKVETQVSVDASFEKISETSEKYNPDEQVARSTQTTEEVTSNSNKQGGEVSVANELTGENAEAGAGSSENSQKTDEITNFEISKTITSKVDDVAKIKRISVAVLVDGKYSKDTLGNDIYIPRTDEEIDLLKLLVRNAIGFDESRGDKVDVVNLEFSKDSGVSLPTEDPFAWIKEDLDSIIKTIVLGIVAILVIMLIIKPLVGKAFEISASDLEAEEIKNQASMEALQKQLERAEQGGIGIGGSGGGGGDKGGVNLDVIQSKIEYSPAQKVNDIIENNPEETLAVIRGWLGENK